MKKKPTQADVASLAGVSRTTVSFVVNNLADEKAIPAETSERVWAAIRELRYVPNQQATHLKRRATNRICFILQRLGIPFNDIMLRDFRKHTSAAGYTVLTAVGDTQAQIEQLLLQVRGGLADGVYLDLGYGNIKDMTHILDQLQHIGLPVIVSADLDPTPDYDTYWATEKKATYDAVLHLIERGHRKIAFLGHNIAHLKRYGRYQGYKQALADNGIDLNPAYTCIGNDTRHAAHETLLELLNLPERPTAIFCTADINALTIIASAQRLGLHVPDDLAVVGSGNISEGEYAHPRLTTIGPPQRTFEDIAALMLHRLTAPKQQPRQKVVQEWRLIVRESS